MTVCPVTGGRLGSATYTLVNDDELLVGNVIGDRYHVHEILGQGSTGTVFVASHTSFARHAAMKVLRPRYVSVDAAARIFRADVLEALSISHPSLVEVFDIGALPDGAPFLVMERLEGETLADRLGRERFSVAAAADVMMQLLSAMEAVHARDLLVRDLRPQNVFLAARNGCRPVVKVLDLGLSRMIPLERVEAQWDGLRAAVGPNESTGALSIPYYLSPERIRGEQDVTASSDIFVAATILYEALTAQKAFSGASWSALLAQIEQARPTPIAIVRPDVPDDLTELITRALSADPRSRPATAAEMQDELRRVFEAPRRASSSMRTAPSNGAAGDAPTLPRKRATPHTPFVGAASAPALAATEPQRATATSTNTRPSARTTGPRAGALPSLDDPYDNEPGTDRLSVDATLSPIATVDEASAEHPVRTLRPPSRADIDIAVEIPIDAVRDTSPGGEADEDDETATRDLTPELQAHIEQMTRAATTEPPESVDGAELASPVRPAKPRR